MFGAADREAWYGDAADIPLDTLLPEPYNAERRALEEGMDPEVVEELRRRGHDVTVGDPWSEGRMCAVARDPETGVLSAAANPRGMQGYAVGR
ncbi:gamma-glutamyltransferase [Streptomyces sp. Ncost-T10-10d]|uniref:gamma-glutamyltransferase n=1 Tax=Streptomyces sp. Ncost-T10-10d TaxID=1839774 RepID=UPI00081E5D9C|nr:gamma-glutamyltranspeptidase / glutathione hydrolase [Streptomyces sp. Ncost-T10-10d]